MTPTVGLPYSIFSPCAPYRAPTRLPSSVRSRKPRPYLARKRRWLAASSAEMPSTSTPAPAKPERASLNWHASFVQPGVSSFG